MAKKKIDFDKYAAGLFTRTEQYADRVRRHYATAVDELLKLTAGGDLGASGAFSFGDNTKLSEKANSILRGLYSAVYGEIQNGVQAEWEYANLSCDALIESIFGKGLNESNHFARWFSRNKDAMDSFFRRKSAYGGLNLSQKVWKYTGDLKTEMECALTLSLGQGDSAATVSRRVRQYLQEPDKMFRRFRVKTGEKKIYDEEGNVIGTEPIYGRRWKRKVIDPQTGAVTWENFNPRNYHPGRGVYRSSYKNAMRLTRTETNMAYRTAEQDRWQRMDFVVGYEIKLSNNHPMPDICNDLKGKYPKDFVFKGWHPQCRCYVVPILSSHEEFVKMEKAILDGKEPPSPSGIIRKPPKGLRDWWRENQERVESATSIPYWVADNHDYIYTGRSKITREELLRRWEERAKKNQNILTMASNVSKVAKYYPEIDLTKLEEYIAGKQVGMADQEARAVAQQVLAAKKDEQLLSQLIPDVHGWKAQFSSAELHQVYNAVEKYINANNHGSLEQLRNALASEAEWVKNHPKYTTSKVAQAAYEYQTKLVEEQIWWRDAQTKSATISANLGAQFPKDAKMLTSAIANHDRKTAEFFINKFDKWENALGRAETIYKGIGADYPELVKELKSQIKKGHIKNVMAELDVLEQWNVVNGALQTAKGIAGASDEIKLLIGEIEAQIKARDLAGAHTSAAALNALARGDIDTFIKNNFGFHVSDQASYERIMNMFGNSSEIPWTTASREARQALVDYTGSYSSGILHDTGLGIYNKRAELMDQILDKTAVGQDIVLRSGQYHDVAGYIWGDEFRAMLEAGDLDGLNKKFGSTVGVNKAYMSTSYTKHGGFSGDYEMCLYCPKGTNMINASGFSSCDRLSRGVDWDGREFYSVYRDGGESEIIIHRGLKFRFLKAEAGAGKGGTTRLYIEIVGREA